MNNLTMNYQAAGQLRNQKGKEGSLGFTFKKDKTSSLFVVSSIKAGGFADTSGLVLSKVSPYSPGPCV